jgi:superfamily II DNA or RNA helicase
MSVRINRNLLNESLIQTIRKTLILNPVQPKSFNYNNFSTPIQRDPIQFYFVKEESDGSKYVHLPYAFGNILMGANVNSNNIYPIFDLQFTKTLRMKQPEYVQTALTQLQSYGTTTLELPTGTGKTAITAYLSTILKHRTLIIVHLSVLVNQWIKTFTEFTNGKIWVVGETEFTPDCNIIICMEERVKKIQSDILYSIGTLAIDEADRLTTKSRVEPLLLCTPRYIILMTATLDLRTDCMDSMLYLLAGTHKVSDTVEKKITLYRVNTPFNPPVIKTARGTDWNSVRQWLCNNSDRNSEIVESALYYNNHKILILCHLVNHVKILHSMFAERGVSVDYICGTKKSYNDSRILIGSVSKVGIGFDDSSSSNNDGIRINMLILTNSIKNESLLIQVLGRIRADNPKILYFVDECDIVKRHFAVCKKYIGKTNGIVINTSLNTLKNLNIPNESIPDNGAQIRERDLLNIGKIIEPEIDLCISNIIDSSDESDDSKDSNESINIEKKSVEPTIKTPTIIKAPKLIFKNKT